MPNLTPSRLGFVSLLLCCFVHSVTCQDRPEKMVQGFYAAIREVAFPKSPKIIQSATNLDTRFILMMPGKVLNHFDYHPGPDYLTFIQNPNKDSKFEVVPPHVMEKWFDLADVIPSANPYNGQDTGRSLANIYKSMLNEMTIKNIDDQGEQILSFYNEALDYLNEVVKHPENLTRTATRLALYNEYKELYNDRRLEMEDKIAMKRRSLQYIEYELWFQRNYPPLQSKVESAYVRWLIFGQKELCDIYITLLDTGSSAKQLEEARIIMRSAGVTALDRTRTIYPVSFEPSDWFKYLLPSEATPPTRAELRNLLGRIESKIACVQGRIRFYTSKTSINFFSRMRKKTNEVQGNSTLSLKNAVSSFVESELECSVQNMGIDTGPTDSCEAMSNNSISLQEALRKKAEAFANERLGVFSGKSKIDYLKDIKSKLEKKRNKIRALLREAEPMINSILKSDPEVVEAVINSAREDQWLQFTFDSKEMESSSDFTTFNIRSEHKKRSGNFFYRKTTTNVKTYAQQKFDEEMNQADLKVKGKLLRVHIKRPWFKPEIFDDGKLNFVSNSGTGQRVLGSPGRLLSEADFINAITGGDGPDEYIYRLPEYVTSFLLAKNIEFEISSKSSSLYRTFVSEMSSTSHTSAMNVLVAQARSSSFSSTSSSKGRSQVERTASGFKLKVPGVLVIGYYTTVLPKFPL